MKILGTKMNFSRAFDLGKNHKDDLGSKLDLGFGSMRHRTAILKAGRLSQYNWDLSLGEIMN